MFDMNPHYCLDVKLETGWSGGAVLALITRMFDQLVDGLLVDVQRTGSRGLHEKIIINQITLLK